MNYQLKFWINLYEAMITQHLDEGDAKSREYKWDGFTIDFRRTDYGSPSGSKDLARYTFTDNLDLVEFDVQSDQGFKVTLVKVEKEGLSVDIIKDYETVIKVFKDLIEPSINGMSQVWFS